MAVRKGSSKRSGSTRGTGKVAKVMREYKRGELKSGGGRKVGSRKQAIAIGLSEARRAGAGIPKKKTAAKKTAAAKPATKKRAAAKRPAKKKGAARKR